MVMPEKMAASTRYWGQRYDVVARVACYVNRRARHGARNWILERISGMMEEARPHWKIAEWPFAWGWRQRLQIDG